LSFFVESKLKKKVNGSYKLGRANYTTNIVVYFSIFLFLYMPFY